MNLKHYLRGLGIGMLVTAVVLGFTTKAEKMTDAEIKVRAAQLGMIEETVLSDLGSKERDEDEKVNSSEALTESSAEENTIEVESTEEDSSEAESIDNDEDIEEERILSETSSQNEEGGSSQGVVVTEENYIIFTIEQGENSKQISQKLHAAGIIESTEDYNEYIKSNDYSRRLTAGTHRIPVDASIEEVVRILCRLD